MHKKPKNNEIYMPLFLPCVHNKPKNNEIYASFFQHDSIVRFRSEYWYGMSGGQTGKQRERPRPDPDSTVSLQSPVSIPLRLCSAPARRSAEVSLEYGFRSQTSGTHFANRTPPSQEDFSVLRRACYVSRCGRLNRRLKTGQPSRDEVVSRRGGHLETTRAISRRAGDPSRETRPEIISRWVGGPS